jgi:hypothetical protein
MVEIALSEEGGRNAKTALRDAERRSVKVVAGARNWLNLLLVAWVAPWTVSRGR